MKNGKWLGILLSVILLALIGAGAIATYPTFYEKAQKTTRNYYEEENFVYNLAESNYSLYWKLKQQGAEKELTPLEVFMPDYEAPKPVRAQSTYAGTAEEYAYATSDYEYEQEYLYEEVQSFNNSFRDRYFSMKTGRNISFWVKDNTNGTTLSNLKPSFKDEVEANGNISQIESQFKYYIKLVYDKDGNAEIQNRYGASAESQNILTDINLEEMMYWYNQLDMVDYYGSINEPKDMTVIYAIEDSQQNWYYSYWEKRMNFMNSGFGFVYLGALGLVLILGLLLPLIKPLGLGKGISRVIPLELCLAGACMLAAMIEPFSEMAIETASGSIYQSLIDNSFSHSAASILTYGMNFFAWFFTLGGAYLIALSIRQIFTMGPKQYLLKKCWCIRFTAWCVRGVKALFYDMCRVDLSEKSNKTLCKTIFANFVILTLICCFWFFGVVGLILYSIILFLIIKSRLDDAKAGYQKMMAYIRKMKEGRLDLTIEDDLDVFEPMKQELEDLSLGMYAAVEKVTENQRMTSSMLYDAAASLEEPLKKLMEVAERVSAEETEEGKQRLLEEIKSQAAKLGPVIDRLKSASSASAQNSKVESEPVDISALIKQVQFELSEQAEAAGIAFRLQLPEEKVQLTLDSEKTYQIFDILFRNILKYGQTGSRAYITVRDFEDRVEVALKNTSANELEGSAFYTDKEKSGGLNTALARSLAELMGGSCDTTTDGDLYKTILTFEKQLIL